MWAPRVYERRYTRTPGIVCATGLGLGLRLVLQMSQKFRVRVWGSYRSYRNSRCGTEVLQNSQKFRVLWHGRKELYICYKNGIPYPGYLWHWRTELPEVPGTGMNVLQNS